ncbi:MAG: serine hydrolase [Clostridia bacterium]|nr:serine hydrolase [Clostridia bacterium]
MKKQSKSAILRFSLLVTAFLLVLSALLVLQRYIPEEPLPPDGSTDVTDVLSDPSSEESDKTDLPATSTDTGTGSVTSTDVTPPPPTYDVDTEVLRQLAQPLFASTKYAAKHVVVMDLTTGTILFEKDSDAKITAASTVKLLTALTMLDYVNEDTLFTVGSELSLVGKNSSTAGLKKGYTLTVEQILDALLIPSGNDAAYVIAAHVGRILGRDPQIKDADAVALFLEKMNDKARSLGAEASDFTCPDGYPNKTQFTTASDMAKIGQAAAESPEILRTVEKVYVKHKLQSGQTVEFTTTNKLLLPSSSFYYEGTFGFKTGYTGAAGQCFLGGANAYGHKILVAVYNASTSDGRWKDCRTAFDTAAKAIKQAQDAYKQGATQ